MARKRRKSSGVSMISNKCSEEEISVVFAARV